MHRSSPSLTYFWEAEKGSTSTALLFLKPTLAKIASFADELRQIAEASKVTLPIEVLLVNLESRLQAGLAPTGKQTHTVRNHHF